MSPQSLHGPQSLLILNPDEFAEELKTYSDANGFPFAVCTSKDDLLDRLLRWWEIPLPIFILENLDWRMREMSSLSNSLPAYDVVQYLIENKNIPKGISFLSFETREKVWKKGGGNQLLASIFDFISLPTHPSKIKDFPSQPISPVKRVFIKDYLMRNNAYLDKLRHELRFVTGKEKLNRVALMTIVDKLSHCLIEHNLPAFPCLIKLQEVHEETPDERIISLANQLQLCVERTFPNDTYHSKREERIEDRSLVLVEDNEEELLTLKKLFMPFFKTIEEFQNGDSAINYIRNSPQNIAAVIADIELIENKKFWQPYQGIEVLEEAIKHPEILTIGLSRLSTWARRTLEESLEISILFKSPRQVWPEYISPEYIIDKFVELQHSVNVKQKVENQNEQKPAPRPGKIMQMPDPGNSKINISYFAGDLSPFIQTQIKSLKESIQWGKNREHFRITNSSINTPRDFGRELLNQNPTILHMRGWRHANDDTDWIYLADLKNHHHKKMKVENVANMLKLFSNSLRCIILENCYSTKASKLIGKYIPFVIKLNSSESNVSPFLFEENFYDAIASGRSIPWAYNYALVNLEDNPSNLNDVQLDQYPTPPTQP